MNLFSIKQEPRTLSDQLPYYSFDRGTDAIWLKDGSATLSLKITPKDCLNLTDDELESLRFGLTPVLGQLPEGTVFQAIMLRERSDESRNEAYQRWMKSHQAGDDACLSDREREYLFEARKDLLDANLRAGNIFQTRCYLTLRVLPDAKVKTGKNLGPFSHLAYSSLNKRKGEYRNRAEILGDLQSGLASLQAGLETLGFEVSHVPHDERMKIIYEWMNPERARSIEAPDANHEANVSDQIALTDLVEGKQGLSLGRRETRVVSLKSLPEISIPAAMGTLSAAQAPFSLVLSVFVLPQTEERERLLRRQRLAQGMASGNSVRNIMAEAQLRDIEDTLSALISSGERLLAVSFQLVGIEEGRV